MFAGRKFSEQSRWPERPEVLPRRKSRNKQTGLRDRKNATAQASRDLRPYLKPERVRDKKERQVGGRPAKPGSRLHALSTRRAASQDEVRRKTSGNGRG